MSGWVALCEQYPWWTANAVLAAAIVLGALVFPVLRGSASVRCTVVLSVMVVMLWLPWIYRSGAVLPRAVVALTCCAVLVPKLVDSLLVHELWRDRPLREWIASLLDTGRLIHRPNWLFPSPTAAQNLRLLARGIVEVFAGAMLLRWALARDLGAISFWLDHAVKLAAAYLLAFDGGIVLMCGLSRVLGLQVIDFSRNPILATTPADFWRRYNREAGRMLHEDAFKRLGGAHRPHRAIFITFVINGLLHEYLAWIMVGWIQGYQLMFFTLHGLATAGTWHLRPRAASRVIGIILTMSFLYFTSVLFFASVDNFMPWYSRGSILP